jgi:hypothetical protein
VARLRVIGRAEAERVQGRDRPRPHGEDVAQDAADPGRRALVGLDEARMVVALHLEDAGRAVADVDHAGVLAGALNHPGRLRRQRAQMEARGFVGAVLVPHRRDDAELGDGRLAADQRLEALVFLRRQPMLLYELRGDGDVVADHRCGRWIGLNPAIAAGTCRGNGSRISSSFPRPSLCFRTNRVVPAQNRLARPSLHTPPHRWRRWRRR